MGFRVPPPPPSNIRPPSPLQLEIIKARANGTIYSSEAERIVRVAKQDGLTAAEKTLLHQLSTDSFSTKAARKVFAEAVEPKRFAPSVKPATNKFDIK